jgi:hypothetical protein
MIGLAIAVFVLISLLLVSIISLAMKTAELTASVNNLTTATNALVHSVDAAVAALGNSGAPSTPDSDIIPLITQIDAQSVALQNAQTRLDAALTPPQQQS